MEVTLDMLLKLKEDYEPSSDQSEVIDKMIRGWFPDYSEGED